MVAQSTHIGKVRKRGRGPLGLLIVLIAMAFVVPPIIAVSQESISSMLVWLGLSETDVSPVKAVDVKVRYNKGAISYVMIKLENTDQNAAHNVEVYVDFIKKNNEVVEAADYPKPVTVDSGSNIVVNFEPAESISVTEFDKVRVFIQLIS